MWNPPNFTQMGNNHVSLLTAAILFSVLFHLWQNFLSVVCIYSPFHVSPLVMISHNSRPLQKLENYEILWDLLNVKCWWFSVDLVKIMHAQTNDRSSARKVFGLRTMNSFRFLCSITGIAKSIGRFRLSWRRAVCLIWIVRQLGPCSLGWIQGEWQKIASCARWTSHFWSYSLKAIH